MIIIIKPVRGEPGHRNPKAGQFEAYLGERLLCVSREPFLQSARVLAAEGVDPDTVITMRHAGSQIDALLGTIGTAARLTVSDAAGAPRFHKWQPNTFWADARTATALVAKQEVAVPQSIP